MDTVSITILLTAIIVILILLGVLIWTLRRYMQIQNEASKLRKEKSNQLEKARKSQMALLIALIKVKLPEVVVRSDETTGNITIINDKSELSIYMPSDQSEEIVLRCKIDGEDWSTRKAIIKLVPTILRLLEK